MTNAAFSQLINATREVPASPENAERLWSCYQQAFRSDEELYRLITDNDDTEQGIDGLTEPLTPADFERLLASVDMLTLEVPEPASEELPPLGFVAVRYCTQEPESIQRFRDDFLGDVFNPDRLEYVSPEDEDYLEALLSAGNVGCFAEFVSIRDKLATLALRISSYQRVCVERMGQAACNFVSKCLDEARIGEHLNPYGNRPVKRQAKDMGLRPIASAWQERVLSLPAGLVSSTDDPSSERVSVIAELKFALYAGNTEQLAEAISRKLSRSAL